MTKVSAVLVALVSMFSMMARGQTNADIKNDIRSLVSNINSDLNSSVASTSDLLRARQELTRAYDLIRGVQVPVPPRRQPPTALTCVSKDDDGREPYQVAVRNPNDFSTKKIPGAIVNQADCRSSVQSSVSAGAKTFFCSSSDADSRDPFTVFAYDSMTGTLTKIVKLGSMADCLSAMAAPLVSRTHAAICGSRDADGRSPYMRFSVDLQTGSVAKIGNTFNTIGECNQSN